MMGPSGTTRILACLDDPVAFSFLGITNVEASQAAILFNAQGGIQSDTHPLPAYQVALHHQERLLCRIDGIHVLLVR